MQPCQKKVTLKAGIVEVNLLKMLEQRQGLREGPREGGSVQAEEPQCRAASDARRQRACDGAAVRHPEPLQVGEAADVLREIALKLCASNVELLQLLQRRELVRNSAAEVGGAEVEVRQLGAAANAGWNL